MTALPDRTERTLGLVIDLSSRMAMANPHLDDPLAAEAVVMIDEVDLHLHPEWQRRVVGDLLVTFPNTQFIITTHSPFIVEALNNHLKRSQLDGLEITHEAIQALLPLSPKEVAAYLITAAIVIVDSGRAKAKAAKEVAVLLFGGFAVETLQMQ